MRQREPDRQCSTCKTPTVRSSRPRGGIEQLLYVLGASIFRCHACADRNLYFVGLRIPANEVRRDHGMELALSAIVTGIVICLTIAFLVLRKFHRLPF